MNAKIVTPWHNISQLDKFLAAWRCDGSHPRLLLSPDTTGAGCANTKNAGIARAIAGGTDIVIVLDDDCYPTPALLEQADPLDAFALGHIASLSARQPVELCRAITQPASRGTPYFERCLPVQPAAAMGYWTNVGDYDAPAQLVRGATHPMRFRSEPMMHRYFPLSGMNVSFFASDWPWFKFVDVPRFDDIWAGFLFQRYAYETGRCIALDAPSVVHSRQSNVWHNLRQEAGNLEANETIWQTIATTPWSDSFSDFVKAVAERCGQEDVRKILLRHSEI